ncbi:hypothetical protein ATER59S_01688 [Aquamicrobium terrae]
MPIETIDTALRRLLGRQRPDPATIGNHRVRRRLAALGPRAELDYHIWLSAKGRPISPASFEDWQHERRIAAGLIFPARDLGRAEWRA